MNELFDRIMDMPVRQRVLLLFGSVFLLFFLYAYLLYLPRNAEIDEKRENLIALEKDRDRKAALVANLPQLRQEVADLNAALKQAVAQLPDTKEIPDLLSGISAVARESGLEIQQFRQKQENYQDFYAEVPVEILIKGTYWQVEQFFKKVADLTRIVNVGDIGIKAPTLIENDPVQLQTSCAATTFRFLDEEEREKIKKEREKKQKEGKK
ncbi:MAG TPA: type 4a pilus biogenesis protein PilO [Candidatus Dormibacteraeota bacterium]|nr:type 4a pilus biogenesis protein PilO [Candidatus Dormibacteraeota bacterium]